MAFVIIAALGQLGIQTTSFIAVLGAAGVLMIIFKPFKVGDFVEGGGASGIVNKIEIFTTTLKTPEKTYLKLCDRQNLIYSIQSLMEA